MWAAKYNILKVKMRKFKLALLFNSLSDFGKMSWEVIQYTANTLETQPTQETHV